MIAAVWYNTQEGFLKLPSDVLKYAFIDLDPVSLTLLERTCRTFRNVIRTLRQQNISVTVKTYYDYCDVSRTREGKRHIIQLNTPYSFCLFSAMYGYLGLLQWFHEKQLSGKIVKLWDRETTYQAARGGHLEVLQWLRAKLCPWDYTTCIAAARGGHLQVLQWARQSGCPWDFDKSVCREAARNGHLHILQWASVAGAPWSESTCAAAAASGHLHILQWLRQNGCPWDPAVCVSSAARGHLEVLQWAIANGCPWTRCVKEECLKILEQNGHLHVVSWLNTQFS